MTNLTVINEIKEFRAGEFIEGVYIQDMGKEVIEYLKYTPIVKDMHGVEYNVENKLLYISTSGNVYIGTSRRNIMDLRMLSYDIDGCVVSPKVSVTLPIAYSNATYMIPAIKELLISTNDNNETLKFNAIIRL